MEKPKTISLLKRFFNVFTIVLKILFKRGLSRPEKLQLFFKQSGGAFLRFGQALALRQDIIPPVYVAELLKLLSNVPPANFANIQNVFISEIGKPIGKVFKEFSDEPVNSASIAQVYKARLEDGSLVAVKIQRPGTIEKFEADFALVSFFARIIDFFRPTSMISVKDVADEFIRWTRQELDFRYGASNNMVFFEYGGANPGVLIPKQYIQFISPKVAVQEFIENGFSVGDLIYGGVKEKELAGKNIDADLMADFLIKETSRQFFMDGFFHSDPRPDNVVLLPDNKMAFIDFEFIGESSAQDRLWTLRFVHSIAQKDINAVIGQLAEFGEIIFNGEIELYMQSDILKRRKAEKIFQEIKKITLDDFKKEIEGVAKSWLEKTEEKTANYFQRSFSSLFFNLLKIAQKHAIELPESIVSFGRALSAVDLMALQMSAGFDIIKTLNSFFSHYPFEQTQELIAGESGEKIKKIEAKINSADGDWEKFLESSSAKKDKIMAAKERVLERMLYYAEKYPQVREALKKLRKRTIS